MDDEPEPFFGSPRRPGWLRKIVLAGVGAFLVWQVATSTLVAFLAERAPKVATFLSPSNATAQVAIVTRAIYDEETLGRPNRVRLAVPDLLTLGTRLNVPDAASGGASREEADTEDSKTTKANGADATQQEIPPLEELRLRAIAALETEPMNARALTTLGLISEKIALDPAHAAGAQEPQATPQAIASQPMVASLMAAAVRRSRHESAAVHWLMKQALVDGDARLAVQYADVLLRNRPEVTKGVAARLIDTLEQSPDAKLKGAVTGNLSKLLASDPPWRKRFLMLLPETITDGKTPLPLLMAVKNGGGEPLAPDELRNYLNLLIRNQLYDLAYYAWLQFLPVAQLKALGTIYNASFELNPSGLPFDWVVLPGSGVTVDLVERPDLAGRALVLQFTQGRVDFRGLTQILMLPPGRYRFASKYMGALTGRRGLVWRVHCADDDSVLGEISIPTGVQPEWTDYEFDFVVPSPEESPSPSSGSAAAPAASSSTPDARPSKPAGRGDVTARRRAESQPACRAQTLRLLLDARSMSERLLTGDAWVDDIKITLAPDQEAPAGIPAQRSQ